MCIRESPNWPEKVGGWRIVRVYAGQALNAVSADELAEYLEAAATAA